MMGKLLAIPTPIHTIRHLINNLCSTHKTKADTGSTLIKLNEQIQHTSKGV